jgi:hypothetical protein
MIKDASTFSPLPDDSDVTAIFLKLPTSNIVLLKFLLESYEGFGELRTLDREKGEVVILAMPDTAEELRNVLAASGDALACREIAAPEYCQGDWLLAELCEIDSPLS